MFESVGALRYTEIPSGSRHRRVLGWRLVVAVEPDLGAYYRSLIPKHMPTHCTRWPTHITVVRPFKERPPSLARTWRKYEGEIVTFSYDPEVRIDKTYYRLNVWCDRLVEIREELGLPAKSRWTLPPSGGHQCFHTTIANKKAN